MSTRVTSLAAVAVAIGFSLPTAGHAAAIFGSASAILSRPCSASTGSIDSSGNCIIAPGTINFRQTDGGLSTGLSANYTNLAGSGASGQASVSFDGGYIPTVRVGDVATDTRTYVSAWAFESFTYTGSAAIDLALAGSLHYVTSGDTSTGDGLNEGTIYAALGVLSMSDFAGLGPTSTATDILGISNVSSPQCSTGAIAAAEYGAGARETLGQTAGSYRIPVGLTSACGGGAITINPGDTFVVVAALTAVASQGGFLDAMHTFTVQIDPDHTYLSGTTTLIDPTVLGTSLKASAAPEPAAWALMVTGFGGLGALLRRRRQTVYPVPA